MKRLVPLLIIAGIVITSSLSLAQEAWKGTAGLLHVYDASTVGKGKLVFSLGTSYTKRTEQLNLGPGSFLNGTSLTDAEVNYHFFISRAALTFGLSDYIEFSAALNIRNWIMQVGSEYKKDGLESRTRGGIGDTDLLLKFSPPLPTGFFRFGVLGYVNFPTGNKERRFTTENVDYGVKGLFTFDFSEAENFVPTKLHFNVGYKFNKNEKYGYGILYANNPDSSGFYPPAYPSVPVGEKESFNDVFEFGTGLEFIAKNTSLFLEFNWDNFINVNFPDTGHTSVYTLTPGVAFRSGNGSGITIAADFNLNSESNPAFVNPPDWTVYFMFSVGGFVLPQDQDDDGIEDKVDKCPDKAEDFDGFEDEDGCPDLDNDADGLKDDVDKCPDLAEDFDGFQDEDGCPDLDNDADGIPDVDDRCPNEPEDFDGVEDTDGCPDVVQDSDNDGVPDNIDKCPLKAEDVDGFQDEDGCPDLDNDLDGILDKDDQCPNEPESFNGYMDEDGCPDERPIEQRLILKGVHFESGSAALTPDSYAVLDQVVRSLMAYPEVRVEIRGYTDSVGSWEYNLKLSQKRAEAVKQYLVNSGIDPNRLVAKGYGEADPIASNKTAEGRAQNRRIEFRRLN